MSAFIDVDLLLDIACNSMFKWQSRCVYSTTVWYGIVVLISFQKTPSCGTLKLVYDDSPLALLFLSGASGPHVFRFVDFVPLFLWQKHGDVFEANLVFRIAKGRNVFFGEV